MSLYTQICAEQDRVAAAFLDAAVARAVSDAVARKQQEISALQDRIGTLLLDADQMQQTIEQLQTLVLRQDMDPETLGRLQELVKQQRET